MDVNAEFGRTKNCVLAVEAEWAGCFSPSSSCRFKTKNAILSNVNAPNVLLYFFLSYIRSYIMQNSIHLSLSCQ